MVELSADAVVLFTVFIAASVNGGLGYGFSSITVPVAILFHTSKVLNPALVPVEVVLNAITVVVNRRAIPRVWRKVLPMLVGAVPGVVVGTVTLAAVSGPYLRLATLGVMLPLIFLQTLGLRRPLPTDRWLGLPVGASIGALYAATTISGPPLALVFNNQGFTKEEFRAALGLFRLLESSLTAVAYLVMGLYSAQSLALGAQMVPFILAGLPVGVLVLRRLDGERFRRLCMGTDVLLVSFGLSRAVLQLELAPAWLVWSGFAAVTAAALSVVVRFFLRSRTAPAELVPATEGAR